MDYSKIFNNLYVGSCPKNNADVVEISAIWPRHTPIVIIDLQTVKDKEHHGVPAGGLVTYYMDLISVPVEDFNKEDMNKKMPNIIAYMVHAVIKGRCIYLHCSLGINRAPTVALYYMVHVLGMDPVCAVEYLLGVRPKSKPAIDRIVPSGITSPRAMNILRPMRGGGGGVSKCVKALPKKR